MGLRTTGSIQLKDYTGDLIGLRYLGNDVNVDTQWGVQTAARAAVIKFTKDGDVIKANSVGSTLVFQRAVANEIRGSADWAVGVFEEVPHVTEAAPDGTMYQLTPPDVDLADLAAAMQAAGIAI